MTFPAGPKIGEPPEKILRLNPAVEGFKPLHVFRLVFHIRAVEHRGCEVELELPPGTAAHVLLEHRFARHTLNAVVSGALGEPVHMHHAVRQSRIIFQVVPDC